MDNKEKSTVNQQEKYISILNDYDELTVFNQDIKRDLIIKLFDSDAVNVLTKATFFRKKKQISEIINQNDYSEKLVKLISSLQYKDIFKNCYLDKYYFENLDELYEYCKFIYSDDFNEHIEITLRKNIKTDIVLYALFTYLGFSRDEIKDITINNLTLPKMQIKFKNRILQIKNKEAFLFLVSILNDRPDRNEVKLKRSIARFNRIKEGHLKKLFRVGLKESGEFDNLFKIMSQNNYPINVQSARNTLKELKISAFNDYQYIDRYICWVKKYKKS